MIRKLGLVALVMICLHKLAWAERGEAPDLDDPAQEARLNQDLWESRQETPYAQMLAYVSKAQQKSRKRLETRAALPDGWSINPAGVQKLLGRMPAEEVVFANRLVVLNNGYYRGESPVASVLYLESGVKDKDLYFGGLFPCARVGLDGKLYISGGDAQKLYCVNKQWQQEKEYALPGLVAGLAALDATHLAVALLYSNGDKGFEDGKLVLLNTASGVVEQSLEAGAYPYALALVNDKLFVTLTGEDRVKIYRWQQGRLQAEKSVALGRGPLALKADGGRLYVVNSSSDNVSVLDTVSDEVVDTFSLNPWGFHFGAAPTSCELDQEHLYVSLAGANAVAVLDKHLGNGLGLVPTGWYPTKVLAQGGRLYVLSAKGIEARRPNPNGPQPGKTQGGPGYVLNLLQGSLSIVDEEEFGARLEEWTRQVREGAPLAGRQGGFKLPIHHVFYVIRENRTYDQVLGDLGKGDGDPKLTLFGKEITPNGHALAKQFVDLDHFFTDGEISVLGHSYTTSGYASPLLEWAGNLSYAGRLAPPDLKDASKRRDFYPFGTEEGLFSPAYLWDALDAKGLDYRIYGEPYYLFAKPFRLLTQFFGRQGELVQKFHQQALALSNNKDRGKAFTQLTQDYLGRANTLEDAKALLQDVTFCAQLSRLYVGDSSLAEECKKNQGLREAFADFLLRYAFGYAAWDLGVSDLERLKTWKQDFERQLRAKSVPDLEYIWLPNDHTAGDAKNLPTPAQYVSQNDAALGLLVDTISHSPVWSQSLVLVEEDDAQNGPDHVDATRSVALAAGPYVKRGKVLSSTHDQAGLLRTAEVILGLDPLGLNDALALPWWDIFSSGPDLRPYEATKPSGEMASEDKKRYEELINNK